MKRKFVIVEFQTLKEGAIFRQNNCWWKKRKRWGREAILISGGMFVKDDRHIFKGTFEQTELVVAPIESIYLFSDKKNIIEEFEVGCGFTRYGPERR
jgi:hypothetical protein